MRISYKLADGTIFNWNVSEDVGNDYLGFIEKQEKVNRKETRRHTSLSAFNYEDARYFSDGSNICDDLAISDAVKSVLDCLTERERYLIIKVHYESYTYTEIAKAESKAPSTIMREAKKASDKFKRLYTGDDYPAQNPALAVA